MTRRRSDPVADLPLVSSLPLDAAGHLRRPKIVGFIGWICAGLGYVGFVVKGGMLPSYFMDMKWLNPEWRPMPYSRGQFATAVTIHLLDMAYALVAIAAGLGTLKLREWGRRLVVYYALAGVPFILLKAAWQVWMFDFMLDYQISTTTQPVDRTSMGNMQFFALLVTTGAQLLWCAILASIMTRQYIKDVFAAATFGAVPDNDWRSDSAETSA